MRKGPEGGKFGLNEKMKMTCFTYSSVKKRVSKADWRGQKSPIAYLEFPGEKTVRS